MKHCLIIYETIQLKLNFTFNPKFPEEWNFKEISLKSIKQNQIFQTFI